MFPQMHGLFFVALTQFNTRGIIRMIEAIITGAVAIVVCMINNAYQQKAARKQHSNTIELIEYKLDELSKRVNKHNNLVERTYKLEQHEAVIQEQIKVANHRIDDLEHQEMAGE